MELNELKPCPFCGCEEIELNTENEKDCPYEGLNYRTYTVMCSNCHSTGGGAAGYISNVHRKELIEGEDKILSRAIENWNRRANDT